MFISGRKNTGRDKGKKRKMQRYKYNLKYNIV